MKPDSAAIVGCGYVGLALSRALCAQGIAVHATSRNQERFPEIEATGATPVIADVLDPRSLDFLLDVQPCVVFDLVRPQRNGQGTLTAAGTANLAARVSRCADTSLIYLSSTSVYGRQDGKLTDESTPVAPTSPLGQARVEAEQALLDAADVDGLDLRICRVPGIYGPGRTMRDRMERGDYRLLRDRETWISRIHIDDLVAGLIAAWKHGRPGRIYLLCDDEPTTARKYAELLASLASIDLPPSLDAEDLRAELGPDVFERKVGSRRCSNRKMREELHVDLRYPSIETGLPAALQLEGSI